METKSTEQVGPKRTLLQRINYAYDPLVGSFSVAIFGLVTTGEIVGGFFEWQERIAKAFNLPEAAISIANIIFYLCIVILTIRAVFLVAERCGLAEERLVHAKATIRNHVGTMGCVHDAIHLTRNDLLTTENLGKLIDASDEESEQMLYRTMQSQLAMLQKSMRGLSKSECQVCYKAVRAGRGPGGSDGLVTLCYGPAVESERRQNSRVLPTNQGIAAEAIISRKIVHTNDSLKDDRFWPREEREKLSSYYRTVVSAPIIVNGVVEGVLCLDWKNPDCYCHDDYANILAAFSDMMSTACYLHQLSRILHNGLSEPTEPSHG